MENILDLSRLSRLAHSAKGSPNNIFTVTIFLTPTCCIWWFDNHKAIPSIEKRMIFRVISELGCFSGASFSKNLKFSSDFKHGKDIGYQGDLMNVSLSLDLRFLQKLATGPMEPRG